MFVELASASSPIVLLQHPEIIKERRIKKLKQISELLHNSISTHTKSQE
jgi:hypothetical protein